MLTEIDKDYYCSAGSFQTDGKCVDAICAPSQMCNKLCRNYHCKYPTPEQFKKEYGEEWTGAVYTMCTNFDNEECEADCERGWELWVNEEYAKTRAYCEDADVIIVCACTPFGIPPKDWRPT